MAEVRRTAAQARAEAKVDWVRVLATTEEEMRQQAIQDGEDVNDPRPFEEPVESIRRRLGMTQMQFAKALGIPVATIRNWEQKRASPDRPALALLRIVAREPEAALRALAA